MPLTHNPALLRELDIETFWEAANVEERRVLIRELIEWVMVFPDHLEVKVVGAPQLNVRLREVGRKVPVIVGVEEPKQESCYEPLAT